MTAPRARLEIPLFVALDLDSDIHALDLIRRTEKFVGGFKVGPRLGLRFGQSFLREVARRGPLFVDNKYFDIPSTMVAAVRASFEAGASFCTVHAQAGLPALRQLARLEDELCQARPFRILCVTVLTSFKNEDLPLTQDIPIARQVNRLAEITLEAGLSGIVCSPHEVQELRRRYPESYLVTPGVRLTEDAAGDQSRTADPKRALAAGASALVVGRPIIEAPEPALAAKVYYEEVQTRPRT